MVHWSSHIAFMLPNYVSGGGSGALEPTYCFHVAELCVVE